MCYDKIELSSQNVDTNLDSIGSTLGKRKRIFIIYLLQIWHFNFDFESSNENLHYL
jgi:hypothetical protein